MNKVVVEQGISSSRSKVGSLSKKPSSKGREIRTKIFAYDV